MASFEEDEWQLQLTEVEVILEDEVTEERYECKDCSAIMKTHYELLSHGKNKHQKSGPQPHTIKEWWESVGGVPCQFTDNAMDYFRNTFSSTHKSFLMKKFSRDGISVIPCLFPDMQRYHSIELTRKMFDRFIFSSESDVQNEPAPITNDDRHIIEYIGGYILQKLSKNGEPMTDRFVGTEGFTSGSLISVLNDSSYGCLTVPTCDLTEFLLKVEIKFRKFYSSEHVIQTALSSIDFSELSKAFVGLDDCSTKLLSKIAHYFLKIRCHQKARCLKNKFRLKHDQNVSLRKSLK